MSYEYEPVTTFFRPTIWSEDVSISLRKWGMKLNSRSKADSVWYRVTIGTHSRIPLKVRLYIWNAIADVASAKCKSGECVKVIYLGRHGHGMCSSSFVHLSYRTSGLAHADNPGEHNIIHEQYPTWEQVSHPPSTPEPTHQYSTSTNKKAKKVHTPNDASLAPSGITEALEVASALKREVVKGMPVPEKFFVSSLKRTGETCGLEWGWLSGNGTTTETGKAGWVEGEDRGCGIGATVIEVCTSLI